MPLFGFFDYTSAGRGVAKNAPEKKPFFKFWELFFRKFWKFFQVNLLYFAFCIPIITIGPATVAMTQVMRKFTLEQPIFIFEEFWNAFKKNFKQGLIIGLFDIFFIISFVVAVLYYFFLTETEPTVFNIALTSITIAAGLFIWMMHFYIYPQIAALSLSLTQILKNSFFLVILGIKRNIVTLFVSIAVIVAMFFTITVSVVLLPFIPMAWLCFLSVFNSYPVIQKFIINPYYEKLGERNPEIPDYSYNENESEEDKPLFEDFGGREEAIKAKPKFKGKVIK